MNKQEARQIKENPYSKIIEEMKKQGSNEAIPTIQIGRIISPSPLVVQIGDLPVDYDNILIAKHLTEINLSQGDQVAVLATKDKQTYIVLAKLVKP